MKKSERDRNFQPSEQFLPQCLILGTAKFLPFPFWQDSFKVHIFWKGHKKPWNLHRRFDDYFVCVKYMAKILSFFVVFLDIMNFTFELPIYWGSFHKLHLQFFEFFWPRLNFYCSEFLLTIYPPLNANVNCESSLNI